MWDLSLNKAEDEDFFRVIGNNYNQDQSRRLVFCPRHKYGKEEVHIIHDKELVGGHIHSLFLTKLICKQRMASSNTSGGWISSQQAQVFESFSFGRNTAAWVQGEA